VIETKFISFNENLSANAFSKLFKKSVALKWTSTRAESMSILDSFDGRMYRKGYLVKYSEGTIVFKGTTKEAPDFSTQVAQINKPLFAHNFRNAGLNKLLRSTLDVRALFERITLFLKVRHFNLVNGDQKTIARGTFVECSRDEQTESPEKVFCSLIPLRGYEKSLNKIMAAWPESLIFDNFEQAVLSAFDFKLVNKSKPVFIFNKGMSMAQAFLAILKESFEIIRQNEQGILDDIDIEFLHDYRVSGRRMRSALSLIKGIVSTERSNAFGRDLKEIGIVSGPLRDLDVYLLREEEYKKLNPGGGSSKELHSIFVTLKSRRRTALKNMRVLLHSEEYQEMVARWENIFEHFDQYVENDTPILTSASGLIYKRFKRILKDGRVLTPQSPDEGFHELRITCKKLRYLIEFFSSLYEAEKISLLLKQLKKLQENLGDFNDLSVQVDTLKGFLASATRKKNIALVQELSGLIAVLSFKKQQLREAFHLLFESFEATENRALFKEMFLLK
jgi:CHAD domain-containing protein